ncbi:MAG: hypothetical protein U1F54_15995 [Burkholderiales bacterium]
MSVRTIRVVTRSMDPGIRRLLSALEALWPLRFVESSNPESAAHAVLVLGPASDGEPWLDHGLPLLVVPIDDRPGHVGRRNVTFGHGDAAPAALAGRTMLEARPTGRNATLAEWSGDAVIASVADGPVWIRRRTAAGAQGIDMSAVPVPRLLPGQALGQYLDRNQFLGALPLLEFCARICADSRWVGHGGRACLVFDDVNLRGSTYGCLDFRTLAASARTRGYHVSMGLIPCDAARVDPGTAALFREHPRELSVVIHGNNHLERELAHDRSREERLAILAEARRRMDRLSRSHRVGFCAVEEPPYGIFRANCVEPLLELGYEAVLCAVSQFLDCNPDFDGPPSFGGGPADYLGSGLATIPRIPFARGWETEALLASYLGQPFVIACHHQDAADDLRHIEEAVDFVNGLGPFDWCSPSRIASSRYTTRREGSTLRLRISGRRVVAAIPDWAETVVVERPWMEADSMEVLRWGAPEGSHRDDLFGRVSPSLPVAGCTEVAIDSSYANTVDPSTVPSTPSGPWPLMRRMLAEARDRSYPYLPRFLRHAAGGLASSE